MHSCTSSGGHSQKQVSLLNLSGGGHFCENGIGLGWHRHVQVSKSTACGASQVMSQMSWQSQVLRLNSWPVGQVVFVTSGQGGSSTHLQTSRSLSNSSSCPQSCGKQVQLQVKGLKVLRFPTALISSFTQASSAPSGQTQKQNSSCPNGQGSIGVGHSQTQSSSLSILGRSQVKVHGVGPGEVGDVVGGAVVVLGGAVAVVGAVVVLGGAAVVVGGAVVASVGAVLLSGGSVVTGDGDVI